MKNNLPKRLKREGLLGPIPSGAVYVGRPFKFGNPFRIRQDGNREEVVRKFGQGIEAGSEFENIIKTELRGKDLVCHCPLDQPCHADILLRIANEP